MSARKSKWTRWKRDKDLPINPDLDPTLINPSGQEKVIIPKGEKTVIKEVPAKANGEVIGICYIYDDGTCDIVVDRDLTDELKAHLYSFQELMIANYGYDPLEHKEVKEDG